MDTDNSIFELEFANDRIGSFAKVIRCAVKESVAYEPSGRYVIRALCNAIEMDLAYMDKIDKDSKN